MDVEKLKETKSRVRLIRRFAEGYRRYFVLAIVMSLVTTLLNALTPQIFRFTIDSVLDKQSFGVPNFFVRLLERIGGREFLRGNLWIIALAVVLVSLFSGIATYVCRVSTAKAGEGFAKNMRDTLFAHVQALPMSWHTRNQTGDIIQRCTSDVEVIRNFVVSQLLEVFRTVFLIVSYFVLMFAMDVKLSLVALAFIPVIVLYSGIFFHLIAKHFTEADEAEGELSTTVQENATGVRVVRAFGREQFEIERFDEKNHIFAKLWIKLGTLSGLYWGVGDLITGLQIVAVIVLGAVAAARGSITVGEFIAFASYNTSLGWPVRSLGRILADMSKAGVSFDRVNYILDGVPEQKEGDAGQVSCAQDITVSHVSFAYEESQPVLEDVSFEIRAGSTLGILGGTGSGKSTLVQLLNRLCEVEEGHGSIRIGDTDIRKIPLDWLRRNVGMVLQEPFLFSRTIRENIAIAAPDASLEEIREVAQIACVDDAIMHFPDGYDTIVGERGITLSGGQRQRIAIARMLIQKPPIMIFDDSLSAVDAQTDIAIRRALQEYCRDVTVILISHRITTLMGADKILVLNRGKIVEQGTHAELTAQDGIYKKIYDIQMNSDDRAWLEGGDADGEADRENVLSI